MKRNYFKIFALLLAFVTMGVAQSNAACYLIGEVDGNGWDPSVGVELEGTGNVYTGVVVINGYFGVTTQLGSSSADWDGCNANRYGGSTSGMTLTNGVAEDLVNTGDYSFQVAATGEPYQVTVDLDAKTLLVETVKLPELTITPDAGKVAVGTMVEITCDDADCTIYYTLDGSEPSSTSTVYLNPIELSAGIVTLKAIAINDDESSKSLISTYAYNVTDDQSAITLKFEKPDDWSSVSIWAWNADGSQNTPGASWPGDIMTDEGDGWWSYTFGEDVELVNVIFNNGQASETIQTGNTNDIVASGSYQFDGAGNPAILVSTSVEGVVTNSDVKAYVAADCVMIQANEDIYSVAIVDMQGKVLESVDADGGNTATVNISAIQSGIYVALVNNTTAIKFVK